ncbi:unnamed protein product, partial [Symbiodinium pilosum]
VILPPLGQSRPFEDDIPSPRWDSVCSFATQANFFIQSLRCTAAGVTICCQQMAEDAYGVFEMIKDVCEGLTGKPDAATEATQEQNSGSSTSACAISGGDVAPCDGKVDGRPTTSIDRQPR